MTNLNGIGTAVAIYQHDKYDDSHNRGVPPDIATLIREQQPAKMFLCPSTGSRLDPAYGTTEELAVAMNDLTDYIYIPVPDEHNKPVIRMFELPSNHGQHLANLLHLYGSVTKEADMRELVRLLNYTNMHMVPERDPDR